MLSEAIAKIKNQQRHIAAGSLEEGIAQVLLELCRESPEAARIIAGTDKTIRDCGKELYDYAKKNKSGSSYYMPPQTARHLICEFYGIEGAAVTATAAPPKPAASPAKEVNILDFLE